MENFPVGLELRNSGPRQRRTQPLHHTATTHIHTHTHACTHIHTYIHTHTHTYIPHTCVHVYNNTGTHTNTQTYSFIPLYHPLVHCHTLGEKREVETQDERQGNMTESSKQYHSNTYNMHAHTHTHTQVACVEHSNTSI